MKLTNIKHHHHHHHHYLFRDAIIVSSAEASSVSPIKRNRPSISRSPVVQSEIPHAARTSVQVCVVVLVVFVVVVFIFLPVLLRCFPAVVSSLRHGKFEVCGRVGVN